MSGAKKVLSAERTSLVALNFQAEPGLLKDWIPEGFQPDLHNGDCYVSLVAVSLRKVLGRGIPFPVCLGLGSIYLRVYICRETKDGILRGFRQVRSVVTSERGKWLLTPLFGNDLKVHKIKQTISGFDGKASETSPPSAEISWISGPDKHESRIKVTGRQRMKLGARNSKVSFILNHHWMFAENDGKTLVYEYRGAPAVIWDAGHVTMQGHMSDLVGDRLARVLGRKPASVFLVENGPVTVLGPFPPEAALQIRKAEEEKEKPVVQ